jgi:hypothetical protein
MLTVHSSYGNKQSWILHFAIQNVKNTFALNALRARQQTTTTRRLNPRVVIGCFARNPDMTATNGNPHALSIPNPQLPSHLIVPSTAQNVSQDPSCSSRI